MVESELGEIPDGWRVGYLKDKFTILMGQSPSGSSYNLSRFRMRIYLSHLTKNNRCYDGSRIISNKKTLPGYKAPLVNGESMSLSMYCKNTSCQ
jgi:hypothetical protein